MSIMDRQRFEDIKNRIVNAKRERNGIGTLQEKTVHAILKDYYAPEKEMQEIPVNGYVADIFTGSEIIEIQTANFNKLREKLDSFLPEYPVTIVYPIPHMKWLSWIDEETGECSPLRKSPKKSNIYSAFYELYKIKGYLDHPNLILRFSLIDIEEYRILNGWSKDKKRGSDRFDRIPVALVDEICFERVEDYLQLIPYELSEPFTVMEFAKAVQIRREEAGRVLHILNYLHVIERCDKKGRAYTYRVKEA